MTTDTAPLSANLRDLRDAQLAVAKELALAAEKAARMEAGVPVGRHPTYWGWEVPGGRQGWPSPWANDRYTRGPGSTTAATWGANGCLAMDYWAWAAYHGYTGTPPEWAAIMNAAGVFRGNFMSFVSRLEPYLRERGETAMAYAFHCRFVKVSGSNRFPEWRNTSADLDLIRRELSAGPLIICIPLGSAYHWLLATEYVPDPTGGPYDDLRVMDPLFGGITSLRCTYDRNKRMAAGGQSYVQWKLVGAHLLGPEPPALADGGAA